MLVTHVGLEITSNNVLQLVEKITVLAPFLGVPLGLRMRYPSEINPQKSTSSLHNEIVPFHDCHDRLASPCESMIGTHPVNDLIKQSTLYCIVARSKHAQIRVLKPFYSSAFSLVVALLHMASPAPTITDGIGIANLPNQVGYPRVMFYRHSLWHIRGTKSSQSGGPILPSWLSVSARFILSRNVVLTWRRRRVRAGEDNSH